MLCSVSFKDKLTALCFPTGCEQEHHHVPWGEAAAGTKLKDTTWPEEQNNTTFKLIFIVIWPAGTNGWSGKVELCFGSGLCTYNYHRRAVRCTFNHQWIWYFCPRGHPWEKTTCFSRSKNKHQDSQDSGKLRTYGQKNEGRVDSLFFHGWQELRADKHLWIVTETTRSTQKFGATSKPRLAVDRVQSILLFLELVVAIVSVRYSKNDRNLDHKNYK